MFISTSLSWIANCTHQSEAVDNNHALQSRLRQANKEINAAREELLDIRREREKIALQMDDIRIRHEIASRKSEVCLVISDAVSMLTYIENERVE